MRIVYLDGYTLNPGDLSWQDLQSLGELVVYDRTSPGEIISRASGADIILTNKNTLSGEMIAALPALKLIAVTATGFNIIDVEAARKRNIPVSNVPGYGTASVVQLTFALLLELCMHTQKHSDSVMAGDWARSPDFCYWNYPLMELSGKTMGIIGFGNIGQKVADAATAFDMNVLGFSRRRSDQSQRINFAWASLDELLERSDVVTIHSPLTGDTKGLINAARLKQMKRTAFLINTARGPIVREDELADALNLDVIAGAGIDVLSEEPPAMHNPLFKAKNCIITPHIAWATREARQRLLDSTVANLKAFIAGRPINVVN